MSVHEIRMVAIGWTVLSIILTVFWYATLSRLALILKDRLTATRSQASLSGIPGIFQFLMRGEFKQTGDERLVGVCSHLRKLLYAYLGAMGAYLVFIVIMVPRVWPR